MKIIKTIVVFLLFLLIVWIDLPGSYPIHFKLGKKDVRFTLTAPSIDWHLGDMEIKRDFQTRLGLDLKGGSHLVFDADISKVKKDDLADALNSARDVIE